MNRKIIVYPFLLIVIGIFFSCCNRPKEVLSRKNMEKLMYDIYIAEAMIDNDYQSFDTPAKKEALINEVFQKHKTTQAQWDTSLSWYSDKIHIYLKMNDSVKARLQRQHKSFEEALTRQLNQEQSLTALSYQPSYIPGNYSFDEVNPKNGFRFRLEESDIADKISDTDFDFSFQVLGIPENTEPNLRAMLMLEYQDTTIYRTETITENRHYSIHGQKYIINDTINKITGFIRLQDSVNAYRNIRLSRIFLGSESDTLQMDQMDEPENLMRALPEQVRMQEEESPQ